MAYYRNYSSKEDILNQYMNEVGRNVHNVLEKSGSRNNLYQYFLLLLKSLGEHSDIGIAAYKANLGNLILSHLNKYMFMTFSSKEDSVKERYKLFSCAGAFYNIFIEWIKNGQQESCEQMAEWCCEYIAMPS